MIWQTIVCRWFCVLYEHREMFIRKEIIFLWKLMYLAGLPAAYFVSLPNLYLVPCGRLQNLPCHCVFSSRGLIFNEPIDWFLYAQYLYCTALNLHILPLVWLVNFCIVKPFGTIIELWFKFYNIWLSCVTRIQYLVCSVLTGTLSFIINRQHLT